MVQLLTHKDSHLSPPSGLMMQVVQTQTSGVKQRVKSPSADTGEIFKHIRGIQITLN